MAIASEERERTGLQAREVRVELGGQTILGSASITVPVGRLVGLIGPSGCGKSTLLRALAGIIEPVAGHVELGGHPVRLRSTDVGYVPFGTLLLPLLTVREALGYAAELRLPPGTTGPEIEARVAEVLEQLQMTDRAEHRIDELSDGQRRRVSCGAELVGRPPVLLLDEPATGLDAVLEARMMRLLRQLADDGRGVLVTTHATSSLDLCDEVAVMAQGGELRFIGPPRAMLERFGVSSFDQVYEALDAEGALVAPAPERPVVAPVGPPPRLERQPVAPLAAQARVLASRYARCTLRDRRLLAILLGQAPVIGLGIGLAIPPDVLDAASTGPYYLVMFLFILLTGCIWLGIISSCREVVRERSIVEREVAAGVRLDAYLVAKCAVLFPLIALQVALLFAVALILQPLGQGADAVLQCFVVLVAVAWAAAAMGLWLSTAVGTPDQATSSVPILLIPQLLFAGAVIPFTTMIAPVQLVADLMISRWALAGLGAVTGLDDDLNADIGAVTGFDPDFFAISPWLGVGVLVAGTLLMISAAGFVLDRRLFGHRARG